MSGDPNPLDERDHMHCTPQGANGPHWLATEVAAPIGMAVAALGPVWLILTGAPAAVVAIAATGVLVTGRTGTLNLDWWRGPAGETTFWSVVSGLAFEREGSNQ